jgi:hypothetical protein
VPETEQDGDGDDEEQRRAVGETGDAIVEAEH